MVDLKAAIDVRVVDVSLPAQTRSGLFKIGAHDDFEFVSMLLTETHQAPRVIERRLRIVDRAGAYNHEKTLVVTAHDRCNLGARGSN